MTTPHRLGSRDVGRVKRITTVVSLSTSVQKARAVRTPTSTLFGGYLRDLRQGGNVDQMGGSFKVSVNDRRCDSDVNGKRGRLTVWLSNCA